LTLEAHAVTTPQKQIERLQQRVERERNARQAAEQFLEAKSLQLYESHQALLKRNEELEQIHQKLESAYLKLHQSEKLASIGLLAAGVAHEINNPLAFVQSNFKMLARYSNLILEALTAAQDMQKEIKEMNEASAAAKKFQQLQQHPDWEFLQSDLPELLEESKQGLERVRVIVQDLKDFSRLGSEHDWQVVDLEQELERTLRICWNDLKYVATIERQFGMIGAVTCQPQRLNQVFLNLLTNAVQALDIDGGIIWLRSGVDTETDSVWVEIEDNGHGIDPDHLNRIFEPFFTTKPMGKGTGLGLALCYGIVQSHGGNIEVESHPGQGARFRVTLPRDVCSKNYKAQSRSAPTPSPK
jgi:signal transduction histidine kinase